MQIEACVLLPYGFAIHHAGLLRAQGKVVGRYDARYLAPRPAAARASGTAPIVHGR